ncbi:MAG: hypothetical protein RSB55_07350, partial [Oscillospiraceae bacterium]
MNESKEQRGKSIFRRMLVLLIVVLLLQMGVYLVMFIRGGVVEQTERNAFYILTERTANRKLYLENEMLQRWSNTEEGESDILAIVRRTLEEENLRPSDLKHDSELCRQVVAQATPDVVALLRRNGVTGAFFVMDAQDQNQDYPGVYIRDYDPDNYSDNNADLLLERGLPTVAREQGIAMDSFWSALFRFDDPAAPEAQFFFAPRNAAQGREYTPDGSAYYCHWSGAFRLSPLDREVMTYSVPLIWEDGTVLGVLGIDITTDLLANHLKYDELGDNKSGAYFLGVTEDGGATYRAVTSSGPNYHAYFNNAKTLTVEPTKYDDTVRVESTANREKSTFYAAVQPLRLYNTNTPFEGEQWALLGIMESESLLWFTHNVQNLAVLSAFVSLLLGLVFVLFAAQTVTKPIRGLVEHLRTSDPNGPIRLRRIHIAEIDTLTEAIENLSNAAVSSASRISKIISMAHIPVGVFEVQ